MIAAKQVPNCFASASSYIGLIEGTDLCTPNKIDRTLILFNVDLNAQRLYQ